jgi:hypothetical protein
MVLCLYSLQRGQIQAPLGAGAKEERRPGASSISRCNDVGEASAISSGDGICRGTAGRRRMGGIRNGCGMADHKQGAYCDGDADGPVGHTVGAGDAYDRRVVA